MVGPTRGGAIGTRHEVFREKTNIMHSALSIDPDQPKHAAQANPDRHFSPPFSGIITLYLFSPKTECVGSD